MEKLEQESKTFCLIEQIDRNTKEDPRLAVFKKEWFEGKDCLDIGCNQGIVTIAIGNLLLITCLLFYVEINWLKSSSPLWLQRTCPPFFGSESTVIQDQ